MDQPTFIKFQKDSENILRHTLLSTKPEEGCALLIGKNNKRGKKNGEQSNIFNIELIWPCCNIWTEKIEFRIEACINQKTSEDIKLSKKNRFLIDPKEQILAHKWARSQQLKILGSAHSHPFSAPIPSSTDLAWCLIPHLMIIVSGSNVMRAWWIKNEEKLPPIEVPFGQKIKQFE